MPHKRRRSSKKFAKGDVLVTKYRFADIPADTPVIVEEIHETAARSVKAGTMLGVMKSVKVPHQTRLRVMYRGALYWSDPALYEEY
jgi:hypothetical protein